MDGVLMKFGSQAYMERLLKLGEIYTRPLREFKKEDAHKRFDCMEGLKQLHYLNEKCKIFIKKHGDDTAKWLQVPITSGKSTVWFDVSQHNYSLFTVTGEQIQKEPYFVVPEGMRQFGDYIVVIRYPGEFLNRLMKICDETRVTGWTAGEVTYYDPNVDQNDLTLWHKPSDHAFAQEFRIIFENRSPEPTSLFLGSLEDIADICHFDQYKGFKFIKASKQQ
jgi:hypothetical protein